jgi:hypothetical protein
MLPISHAWKEGSRSALIGTTTKMDMAIQDMESLVEDWRA